MKLVYSERGSPADGASRNALYFDKVESVATSVVILGDYPHIAKAYELAGVPVEAGQKRANKK
ncbi:MAG: hypothetical protein Q4D05_06215 [Acinetobacter sp.]|nr:hypothetical protein [Acinetobacter sp.]